MNAITRPYTIGYPMDGHDIAVSSLQRGRKTHTLMACECRGLTVEIGLPPNRAKARLNVAYQDHLVDVMESRMR